LRVRAGVKKARAVAKGGPLWTQKQQQQLTFRELQG
jgi:hypothetical protein